MCPIQAFVLIVDDSADTRAVCRGMLAAAGFAVAEASDGLVGLGLAESRRPDVILLNYEMKRMPGDEFVSRLAIACRPAPPVVAIGHRPDAGCRARVFLEKPIASGALLQAVADALTIEN